MGTLGVMRKAPDNPYAILGVLEDASDQALRSTFKTKVIETHPDKGGDSDMFRRVRSAWDLVCDPERRAATDACLYQHRQEMAADYRQWQHNQARAARARAEAEGPLQQRGSRSGKTTSPQSRSAAVEERPYREAMAYVGDEVKDTLFNIWVFVRLGLILLAVVSLLAGALALLIWLEVS